MILIKFCENIYISSELENPNNIMDLMQRGIPSAGVYLVCLNSDSANFLEIYHSTELFKPFINKKNIIVIAACFGKPVGKQICVDLIEKYYKRYGNLLNFKENIMAFRWDD